VEVRTDRAIRPPLPILVPYGVIEGTVPAEQVGPKTVVEVSEYGRSIVIPPVSVGDEGTFRIEVPNGRWYLRAVEAKRRVAELPGGVAVAPGQTVKGVVLRRPPDEKKNSGGSFSNSRPGQGQVVTWAAGTVRDEADRPVANATVWAFAVYHGGIRMYENVKQTTTDAAGRYEIKGDGGLVMFSASLVAHVPGKPPAWAWIQEPFERVSAPIGTLPPAPTVDLVIPARSGRLDVTVVWAGRPVAGAVVGLQLEGVNLKDTWAAGGNTPERTAVEAVVRPIGKTDAAGMARFDALLPGRYRVIAATGDENRVRNMREYVPDYSPEPYGIATGVPIAVDRTTLFRLGIYPQSGATQVRVFQPDGRPLTGGQSFNYWRVGETSGRSTMQTLEADGGCRLHFDGPGLWRADFKYRDRPTKSYPLSGPPYYMAEGVVAVSALLPTNETDPARLTALRIEPGSVVVELKDAAGKPAHGYVEIIEGNMPSHMGSTDDTGVVRFDGVSAWTYTVRASIAGRPAADLGDYQSPLPDDSLLQKRTAVLDEPVTPEPDREKRVILREQAVGYVKATVRPTADRATATYTVYVTEAAARHGARAQYRPATGECDAGPFPAGTARLRLWDYVTNSEVGARDVAIQAGQVARVELTPQAQPSGRLAGSGPMLLGVGGVSHMATGGLTGRVLMPGGKEPALGAHVMYFEPGRWEPVLGGLTDARGQIRSKGLWLTGNQPSSEPADDPPGPILVAVLPGSHGGMIAPPPQPGKPIEISLPLAITLRGKVTVGGASPAGRVGSIRILAAYEGRGKARLAGVLSVRTTAQDDGSFELAGLTPGKYEVQAALDDIWLSPAVTMEIVDRSVYTTALAIPAPGGAVVAKVVGPEDRPLPGRTVTVDRPAGPLTSLLWPAEWTTDGAGEVHIPALEAGRHFLRVKGTAATAEVIVPPLPAAKPVVAQLRVSPAEGR
jgi:hypothetical protein